MGAPFAIYVRVSQVGDREGESFGSPEDQEAAAREWAERAGAEVYFDEAECVDLDVSGGLAAEDRKLGRLIDRCESGEFAGIIVRYESRFARDTIAGGAALKRLHDAGARLVATATGFDSEHLNADSRMVFNIMMSIGQAERERGRGNYMGGKLKAARRGEWCGVAPFGYDRDEDKRLAPNEDADTVRQMYRLRGEGVTFAEIGRRLDLSMTRSGIRKVLSNRTYLGEQRVPDPDCKDEVIVIRDCHAPLVTEKEWQAANAIKGRAPVHRGLAKTTQLKGLVKCGICDGTMHVLAYGKHRDRLTYACTSGCGGTSMAVTKIEPAVLAVLTEAVSKRERHIAAVIEGDNRYSDALAAVEQAQADLEEYRDSLEIQRELGAAQFAVGLRVRKEAIETARRALRSVPRPKPQLSQKKLTLAEFDLADRRDFYSRCIAEVRVFPRSQEQRLMMRWQGSDESFPVPPAQPASGPVPQLAVA